MNNTAKIISACGALVLAAGLAVLAFNLRKDGNDVPTPVIEIQPVTQAPTEAPTMAVYDYVPSENGLTDMSKIFLKENKDYVGWIKIDYTDVDYPILKDPGEVWEDNAYYGGEYYTNNEFYLHHDFDRKYEFAGALFMDYRDEFGSVEDDQSENIIIYGHNMLNNTMFGSLRRYRQDPQFFEQAPFIELSSNYKSYDYVICGCIITGGSWYSDFIYWDMEELDNEDEFNYYIDSMRAKQLFDTGVDVEYGDKLLTLSTCYADADNSRFLVIARRLRDGEVAGDLSTIDRTEEYLKAQKEKEEEKKKEEKDAAAQQ